MRQSVERATRAVALSVALVGSVAETTSAHTVPRSSIIGLARQIDALPAQSSKMSTTAHYVKALPKGAEASVTLGSTTAIDGKPKPASANYIDIGVNPGKAELGKFVAPIVSVSFIKRTDGKWNAYEVTGSPMQANKSHHLEVIGYEQERAFDQTVTEGGIRDTHFAVEHGHSLGKALFQELEFDAESVLQGIIHGDQFTK